MRLRERIYVHIHYRGKPIDFTRNIIFISINNRCKWIYRQRPPEEGIQIYKQTGTVDGYTQRQTRYKLVHKNTIQTQTHSHTYTKTETHSFINLLTHFLIRCVCVHKYIYVNAQIHTSWARSPPNVKKVKNTCLVLLEPWIKAALPQGRRWLNQREIWSTSCKTTSRHTTQASHNDYLYKPRNRSLGTCKIYTKPSSKLWIRLCKRCIKPARLWLSEQRQTY